MTTPTIDDARSVLADVFGYADFRPLQAEAIRVAITGRDLVVLLPTGSGKSICYQVPALVARRRGGGVTLVVSPLIALMQDQVDALAGAGVRAAALNSAQSAEDQRDVIRRLHEDALDLLYVSPERLATPSFRRLVSKLSVALIAIDEAHCVSQWGHDFRPDYLEIGALRELVDAPLIALTATATPRVVDEIRTRLGLPKDAPVVRGNFSRDNLAFVVEHRRLQAERLEALSRAIRVAGLLEGRGRAIVYCATRKTTETVAKALRGEGLPVGYYHAGRTQLARDRAHRAFATGRTRILVSTNAFGMGIDFPDVRLIVHYAAPGSLEAYYQEAGRAGRDGLPARCVMIFSKQDLVTQRRLESASASELVKARRREALAAIERYANASGCRQEVLVQHFTGGEDAVACGLCDRCLDPDVEPEVEVEREAPPITPLAPTDRQRIVSAVDRLRRPVGRTRLAQALRGGRAKSLSRGGLLTLPEYGTLAAYDEKSIVAAIDELLEAGVLRRTGRRFPTVWMANKPVRDTSEPKKRPARRTNRPGMIARALDDYRKRTARKLKWKPYMVMQRRVLTAIDKKRPETHDDLLRIPGLGPAKVERFGDDILQIVQRYADE